MFDLKFMLTFALLFLVGCASRVIEEDSYQEGSCGTSILDCESDSTNMCTAYAFEFDCYARQRQCPGLCSHVYREVSDCFHACEGGYSASLWSHCMNLLVEGLEECEE